MNFPDPTPQEETALTTGGVGKLDRSPRNARSEDDRASVEPPNDLLTRVQALSTLAGFNRWLGLEVVAVAPGDVELQLRWRPEFGQYNDFLHAGIVSALLDTACGFAAYTLSEGDLLASQFAVRFLRPAVADTFVVRGHIVKPGRRQLFAAAELRALEGPPDRLLAVGDAVLVVPEKA